MTTTADAPVSADGRDRRWDDHRQERRARLLAAAIALIDREGGDAGVATIAAEAGIPRSVVYKLFRDRQDLDEQIRRSIVDEMTAVLAPTLVPGGTTRQMVTRGIRTYVDWVSAHPNLHRFLGEGSASAPEHGSPAMTGGKAQFARTLQELADTLLPPAVGAKRLPRGLGMNLANGLVGVVDFAVNGWLTADPSERGTAKRLIEFLSAAACSQIQAAARIAGGEIDLDAPVAG